LTFLSFDSPLKPSYKVIITQFSNFAIAQTFDYRAFARMGGSA
jgi:hypothetical protein